MATNNIFEKGTNYLFNEESKSIIKGTFDYESKLTFDILGKVSSNAFSWKPKKDYVIIIELNELDFKVCVDWLDGFDYHDNRRAAFSPSLINNLIHRDALGRDCGKILEEFQVVDRFRFMYNLVLRNNDVEAGNIRLFNQETFQIITYKIDDLVGF